MINEFYIGVWAQPIFQINGSKLIDLSKKWEDRGITHIITGDFEPKWSGNTVSKYSSWLKSNTNNLKWMAYARPGFETYPNYDNFFGYIMSDEADMKQHWGGSPEIAVKNYLTQIQTIRSKVPNAIILGNFSGSTFTASRPTPTPTQPFTQEHYRKMFSGLDITSTDWYITNTNRDVAKYLKPATGETITRMMNLSNGKPSFSCIECSNQNLDKYSREPTITEFSAQIVMSLIRGAKGIWYFPQRMGGFLSDNMSKSLSDYMTNFNKILKTYGDFFIKGTRDSSSFDEYETSTWTLNGKSITLTLNCTNKQQNIHGKIYNPLEFCIEDSCKNGLLGNYFNNCDLKNPPILKRIDSVIDFNFTPSEIAPLNAGEFSIRWEGYLVPNTTENYTISTFSDDGIKLWINDQLFINKWSRFRGPNSFDINLVQGQKYKIKIEYFQRWGGAQMSLYWQTPTIAKQIIPASNLYNP